MTQASSDYFGRVAGEWDNLRTGFFSTAVRDKAISKGYLLADMRVADVGAGTGFVSAGLAPLVEQVIAIDGSAAMLAVAQENLREWKNIDYRVADGQSLPLADGSVDAVFANMYLHHCSDPLAAIKEMARILKVGGRLVLTDLDSHPYAWLKDEMADVWQGFERSQVLDWFASAGLVNRFSDCSGENCCATSCQADQADPASNEVSISIFLAVGTKGSPDFRESIQQDYTQAIQKHPVQESLVEAPSARGGCGCGSSEDVNDLGYRLVELADAPESAQEVSFGCGNPFAMSELKAGEVVVDIGSGGGLDAFIAGQKVGPGGRVIGVDMTPSMIERSRAAAVKAGYSQVEFRLGYAEELPVPDETADVVISNCVINLCMDKGQVFSEIYRVLKDGGRLEVSDVVTHSSFPACLRGSADQWSGCVSGALPAGEYLDLIAAAGFGQIHTRRSGVTGEAGGVEVYGLLVSAIKNGAPGLSCEADLPSSTGCCPGPVSCC